jgi:3D (Asp-Asp-Asp) domain-containing protein
VTRLVVAAALVIATATVAATVEATEEPRAPAPAPIAPAFRPVPVVEEGLVPHDALSDCEEYVITGYVRTAPYHSSRTYDGTPILTPEPIVAGSWNLPIGTVVQVEGLGRFRVADRGHLGARHIDVAVWSDEEAYALTGIREVCRVGE